ncbi:GtrA family protein [Sharpea porci]|uniref:GtrA family protein n=1 Tax=Sharpea porci TaxID=2652286 RepID=UPI002A9091A2|nr:GtrA family protein [Sharpea porci]MDY5279824.1 GtrA family protein [Sharpea porci]
MNLKMLIGKYNDIIPYVIFGILTTLVNIIIYWICAHPLKMPVILSTIFAWILSVLFAYITNRKWVFHSDAKEINDIFSEMFYFFSARLATGLLDWGVMFIFVDILNLNDMVIKILSNVIVVVLNYVASKTFIFKRNRGE